jgi:GntR family transcriptional regulator, sialic acid-inducible nan operon repressor
MRLAPRGVARHKHMMISGDRIQKRKLSEDVRLRLLGLIERGEVRPGDVLPSERELMESLGVGRPAIREAMQALERTGLIEIRHGERARVAEPSIGRMVDQVTETMKHLLVHSPASLENLKEARVSFEMEMSRIAARRHSAADIDRLTQTVQAQERSADNLPQFRILDGQFHRDLAAISGNPIWTALSDALFRWLTDFHVDLVSVPGLEQVTLSEHRGIIEAIQTGNADRAAEVMANHLNRANELYRKSNMRNP